MSIQNYILFFIIIVASMQPITAQDLIIKGKVTDILKEPIQGVAITLNDIGINKHIINYDISDKNGNYSINIQQKKNLILNASHLNYKRTSDTLTVKSGARTVILNITLSEKKFNLDEIVIQVQKIKDTMVIKTDSLKLTERSTLRDILNKTEGFVVSEEGGITFRGRSIKKVLINEKEVFVNQNKIALDNLEYELMNDLELINNYRDKYNINFDNFTESVININTKEDFKGVFKPTIEAAYGAKNKFLLNLRGLYFSDQINVFSISNTNNIGKKGFSFTNISEEIKEQSSGFFKRHFTDFFSEDNLLTKSFNSNSNITLRKENKKSRLGVVLYYNNFNQLKNTISYTSNNISVLNTEDIGRSRNGNSFLTNLSYYRVLSGKSILSFYSSMAYIDDRDINRSTIYNFSPSTDTIVERNINKATSFLNILKLEFKTKLAEKIIFSSNVEYDIERSINNFNSNYVINTNNASIQQEYGFDNYNFKTETEINYKFSNLLTAALGFKAIVFDENLNYKGVLKRKGNYYQSIISLRGQNKKWEYGIEIVPQYISINYKEEKENKKPFDIFIYSDWNINENNSLVANYEQTNTLTEINYAIDSLIMSYNTRLLNDVYILNNISRYNQLTIGYNYSSIIKTQSFRVAYSYGEEYDYLEPIFQRIEQNIFYYQNRLIDRKKFSKYSVAVGKGFYISKKYHLLRFKTEFSARYDEFPTYTPQESIYNIDQYQYGFKIGIEPKDVFIDELYFSMSVNNQQLFLDNQLINNNKQNTYLGTISKKSDDLEINISVGQELFKNEDFKFKNPFLSMNATIKLNKKMNVFFKGNYLFHLFGFPNTDLTNLSVKSDGNLIHSNYNENNINYLIIGAVYKF